MSIMSDKWIRRMCMAPQGIMHMPTIGEMEMVKNLKGEWISRDFGHPATMYGGYEVTAIAEDPTSFKPMIEPFAPDQVKQKAHRITADEGYLEKVVSYGTSSYGYDLRCSNKFKIFTNINSTVIDPKNFDPKSFVDHEGDKCIIPPNSFALASSIEYFRIPRNVLTVCLGKSTYARCGIVVNVTPFEPEWEGHVTLEFSNTTPLPAIIYANEGVAQILFFRGDEECATSYKDRGGKYMNQSSEPVLPKA